MLCKRHCTGIKPAVNYFRYTMHGTCRISDISWSDASMYGRCSSMVFRHFHPLSFQITPDDAANRFHMSALAFPDIQRCSPVSVTADAPVLYILQPVAETAFSNAFRDPVDGIIVADQVILYCSHLDEPGFSCVVDQRCIATPAMRIIYAQT